MNPIAPSPMRTLRRGAARLVALTACLAGVAFASRLQAATFSITPNAAVPDGSAAGLVSVIDVPLSGYRVVDANVRLTLSGGASPAWNGDLYVLLSHEGSSSVLLNRPGVTGTNPFGYADNGLFDVTFDDEATGGDVHLYQEDPGFSGTPGAPLEGAWQPDGRDADPAFVLDSDPRPLLLKVFDNLEAGGAWRLFVADLSVGGTVRLDHWELILELEPLAIPEPATWGGAAVAAAAIALTFRRRARAHHRAQA